jgi:hypothetical protein
MVFFVNLVKKPAFSFKKNSYRFTGPPFRVNKNSLYVIQLHEEYHRFVPDLIEVTHVEWRKIDHMKKDAKKFPDKYNMWIRLLMRVLRRKIYVGMTGASGLNQRGLK